MCGVNIGGVGRGGKRYGVNLTIVFMYEIMKTKRKFKICPTNCPLMQYCFMYIVGGEIFIIYGLQNQTVSIVYSWHALG